jgi:hypothetical protein
MARTPEALPGDESINYKRIPDNGNYIDKDLTLIPTDQKINIPIDDKIIPDNEIYINMDLTPIPDERIYIDNPDKDKLGDNINIESNPRIPESLV